MMKTMAGEAGPGRNSPEARRARSVRIALSLLSIALVFFLGVFFSRRLGGISVVMSAAGLVLMIVLFVIVAIGSRR